MEVSQARTRDQLDVFLGRLQVLEKLESGKEQSGNGELCQEHPADCGREFRLEVGNVLFGCHLLNDWNGFDGDRGVLSWPQD